MFMLRQVLRAANGSRCGKLVSKSPSRIFRKFLGQQLQLLSVCQTLPIKSMPQNLDILPAQEQRHFAIGIPSTGSASGKSSEMRVTDSGGAVNFAHSIRFPGSEDVSG